MSSSDPYSFGESPAAKRYNVSGKIMLSSVLILLVAVAIVVLLHLYARWYILRSHRRRNRRSPTHLIFHLGRAPHGLDPTVLKALPVFQFQLGSDPVDCPVCLCEFAAGETGRTLPKCRHSFHTDCIGMWFSSHSTCPLCRSTVELPRPERAGSGGKDACRLSVSVEPVGSGDEESPGQIRSPVGKILSKILSRERKGSGPSSSSGEPGFCSSEVDLESGSNHPVTESSRESV